MGIISTYPDDASVSGSDKYLTYDSSGSTKLTPASLIKSYVKDAGGTDFGWTSISDSWTYGSATTINVPSGATSIYSNGMLVKLTQSTGGTKYGTMTNVASTLLTIAWRDGATLANEAITNPFYSSDATPLGAGAIVSAQLLEAFLRGRYQDNATNNTVTGYRIQWGWSYLSYGGTSTGGTKSVTFPAAFAAVPLVSVWNIGLNNSSNPSSIGDFASTKAKSIFHAVNPATTGFDAKNSTGDASSAFSSGERIGFAWLAIGQA